MDQRIMWILKRRSIRKYKGQQVEPDKIEAILQAAMAAPSANNRQPWHFVVVTDKEKLKGLGTEHPYGGMLKEAPLCIAVCGDTEVGISTKTGLPYWVQDCSAAMENLLLAVSTLGLGGVWLGVYPNDERMKMVKGTLGLPDHIIPLGLAAIGYPAEAKPASTYYRKDRVHYQKFKD